MSVYETDLLEYFIVFYFINNTSNLQDAKIESDIARDKAAQYLSSKVPYITDPFQMAITAYALQLAKHKDRDEAYIKLQSMRRRGRSLRLLHTYSLAWSLWHYMFTDYR